MKPPIELPIRFIIDGGEQGYSYFHGLRPRQIDIPRAKQLCSPRFGTRPNRTYHQVSKEPVSIALFLSLLSENSFVFQDQAIQEKAAKTCQTSLQENLSEREKHQNATSGMRLFCVMMTPLSKLKVRVKDRHGRTLKR